MRFEPPAAAKTPYNDTPQLIAVQVYNTASAPARILSRAEEEAAWIFSKANIEISWIDCPPLERKRGSEQICKQPRDPLLFVVAILDDAPGALLEESAMGFALPFTSRASHAAVVFPKIAALHGAKSVDSSALLGHVLAHELAHLVLRSNRHSQGIMRANWTQEDLECISQRRLVFTPQQVRELRTGIQRRQQVFTGIE